MKSTRLKKHTRLKKWILAEASMSEGNALEKKYKDMEQASPGSSKTLTEGPVTEVKSDSKTMDETSPEKW